MRRDFSQEYLRECFDYDPESGALVWKHRPVSHFKNEAGAVSFNSRFAGRPVTNVGKNGYITMSICDHPYLAHRVIWKLVTGRDPVEMIDHIDGNRANNRWENLREATRQQNCMNRTVGSKSATGVSGVRFEPKTGRYIVAVSVRNRSVHVGCFDTLDDAIVARKNALALHYGEFAGWPRS